MIKRKTQISIEHPVAFTKKGNNGEIYVCNSRMYVLCMLLHARAAR